MYITYRMEKLVPFIIGWAGLFGAFDVAPGICWTLIAFSFIQLPLKLQARTSRQAQDAASGARILNIVVFVGLLVAYLAAR